MLYLVQLIILLCLSLMIRNNVKTLQSCILFLCIEVNKLFYVLIKASCACTLYKCFYFSYSVYLLWWQSQASSCYIMSMFSMSKRSKDQITSAASKQDS